MELKSVKHEILYQRFCLIIILSVVGIVLFKLNNFFLRNLSSVYSGTVCDILSSNLAQFLMIFFESVMVNDVSFVSLRNTFFKSLLLESLWFIVKIEMRLLV